MDAKIAVIIPTYNRCSVLPRAIESVLRQSYRSFQLVIVDDGSTDPTEQVVKEYAQRDSRLLYFKTPNRGVSAARNFGLQKTEAPWVAFLDSDDEWLSEKLAKQIQAADEHPDRPLIHGDEIWVRNGVRVNPMKKHEKKAGEVFADAVRLCCISPSTVMIKRSLLAKFGGFREDFPVCEDYDLWLKITSQYPVAFVPTPIIKKYGGHEDQLSRRYVAMDYWRVRALADLLSSPLASGKEVLAQQGLVEKANILLKGYRKHGNLSRYDEVFRLLSKHKKKQDLPGPA